MQSSSPAISLSPSFTTTHSSAPLADIAARVVQEFRLDSDFDDVFGLQNEQKSYDDDDVAQQNPPVQERQEGKEEEDDDDNSDFEFPSVCRDPPQSISADEIFYNGQIRPVFPIFGRKDLLFRDGKVNYPSEARNQSKVRSSLRALMREERELRDPPSCSSSESDDLDGVPAEIYCVWTPKSSEAEVKKSGSTGSSKRWRIRDLLFRSNSDGRTESFVFVPASNGKRKGEKGFKKETTMEKSSFGGGEVVPVTAVQEEEDDYGKDGVAAGVVVKDGERQQLYGRQDWVGFFANVNGVSSNLHPF